MSKSAIKNNELERILVKGLDWVYDEELSTKEFEDSLHQFEAEYNVYIEIDELVGPNKMPTVSISGTHTNVLNALIAYCGGDYEEAYYLVSE